MNNSIQTADETIRKYVLYSMGTSLIPVPVADLVATTAIQVEMVKALSREFNLEYREDVTRAIIGALTGNVVARVGASLIKALPGVGTILGAVSSVTLTGAATFALGQVFVHHVQQGGSLHDFDADSYRRFYDEMYEEGKFRAKQWKEEADAQEQEAQEVTIADEEAPAEESPVAASDSADTPVSETEDPPAEESTPTVESPASPESDPSDEEDKPQS
ncbi:DUF697 domain-containing protein [Pontibacter sp. G13]|uniref:YcjF family protein n=1 Tax=Pontibacter sp. G13 TaxID=3074898 RepID=UPI00288BE7F2|nr:DUF697 domain-containing protein [Pontibacter sp. G13]WNJ17421.1 DUF697 domain-containing protein [Pontibacter sp. G13]